MSGVKFVVRGGRRWRDVDVSTGRVAGWSGARFVYVKRGRLELVARGPVLRGLRALAGGRPTSVRDGPRLSQIRSSDAGIKKDKYNHQVHKCCQHNLKCDTDANFNRILKSTTSVAVQCCRSGSAGGQSGPPATAGPFVRRPFALDGARPRKPSAKRKRSSGDEESRAAPPPPKLRRASARAVSNADDGDASEPTAAARRSPRPSPDRDLHKELIISEEDVMLLRTFVERDADNVFDVDLERFDADEAYKGRVFYKLNPLVNLQRCPRIARLLRERRTRTDSVSLKDFMTTLGLRRVAEADRGREGARARPGPRSRRRRGAARADGDGEPDKENFASPGRPRVERSSDRVLEERGAANAKAAEAGGDGGAKRPGATAARRAPPVKREYSREEDASVVRWVRGAGRAALVNGNRVWRELPALHLRATGRARSWHSLRNRYLRYLLPALGDFALRPEEASRLRAAAATGELKARKMAARRHSAFAANDLPSASGRRPRAPSRSPSPAPLPPPAPLPVAETASSRRRRPPSVSEAEPAAPRTRSGAAARASPAPSYAELTRRFARLHRAAPGSSSEASPGSGGDGDAFAERARRPTTRASAGGAQSPRRRSGRLLGAEKPNPHARRLYNPNAA